MSDDPALQRAIHNAMDDGPPFPSWEDAVERSATFTSQRRRRIVGTVVAVLLALVAVPALALGGHVLFFQDAEPAPKRVVEKFEDLDRQAPPDLAPRPVSAETRKVISEPLSDGRIAVLWVSPAANGGYCVSVDPPGAGPGCTGRVKPFTWGAVSASSRSVVVVYGSALSKNAASVELRYDDGSSFKVGITYVTAPIDAGFFMFELPTGTSASGKKPTQLSLLSQDGGLLETDHGVFGAYFSGAQLESR